MSLTVFDSEVFCIIGENGTGKSVLMNTIAGLGEVEGGMAKAYGYDLFKAFRFHSDNFLTYLT